MSLRPTKVPAIPAPTNTNLLEVAKAIKGNLEVREGLTGDPLDKFVRVRDLSDDLFRLQFGVGGGGGGVGPVGPAGPPGSIPPPDLTPPPAPTGLTTDTTFVSVILQWDSPPGLYIDNHAYTEVWRNTVDNLGTAVLVGTSLTQFYLDAVGDPDTEYYYWIRFRSKANVVGPFNDTDGTYAKTGSDPSKLLSLLTGQITLDQLFTSLATPIANLQARLDELAEDTIASMLSTHEETMSRSTALLNEARDRGTSITEVRRVVAEGDTQLAQTITTLTATVDSGLASGAAALQEERLVRASADAAEALQRALLAAEIQSDFDTVNAAILDEASARVDGDEAEATQRSLLATQMRGAYGGTDVTALTEGLVFSERQARSTAVAAEATSREALSVKVTGVTNPASLTLGTLSAGLLFDERQARATADGAQVTRIDGLEATVNNPATGVVATASALDVVELAVSNGTSGNVALANRATTLEASVNSPTTSNNPTFAQLAVESSARAALDGSVSALYTVRAEVSSGGNTVVGGFGLAATATTAGGPRIDFGVRADRFYVAAPSSTPGIPDVIPFVVQAAPTTINGEAVPAGVYIADAFIKNGTLGSAKIGSLTATKITAGYTASVDLEAGTFFGSEFYIGGTATYEFSNPAQPTQRTGIASVANPNISFTAAGATFDADFFRILNSGVPYVPFEVVGGVVRIKVASIGDATITTAKLAGTLQSDNFSATTGWQINKAGTMKVFELEARGGIRNGTASRSGTTMTGFGVNFSGVDGTGCWGNSTTNLTFDGSAMKMNGRWITSDNLNLGAFTLTVDDPDVSASGPSPVEVSQAVSAIATGGRSPISYSWVLTTSLVNGNASLFTSGSPFSASLTVGARAIGGGSSISGRAICTATDADGRVAQAAVLLSAVETS